MERPQASDGRCRRLFHPREGEVKCKVILFEIEIFHFREAEGRGSFSLSEGGRGCMAVAPSRMDDTLATRSGLQTIAK